MPVTCLAVHQLVTMCLDQESALPEMVDVLFS